MKTETSVSLTFQGKALLIARKNEKVYVQKLNAETTNLNDINLLLSALPGLLNISRKLSCCIINS